jgi:glycine/D-amino acid oxidase-like deaminating enzyme
LSQQPDVVVAGAGVLGVFAALSLVERGARVVLTDPWEPGHARATSSSESRVIRTLYGSDAFYSEWAWRAISAWERWEGELGRQVFFKTGVLWMAREADGYEAAGEVVLRKLGIPVERLEPAALSARHPVIRAEGLQFAVFEPGAGALLARESVRRLAEAFVRRGGRLMRGAAEPGATAKGRLADVRVGSETIAAEHFVFACGPWLPQLFPDLLRETIRVHRAEELYFGVPPGETGFDAEHLPSWLEIGAYYGIPALDGRAFKVGIDTPGPEIDPTSAERCLDPASVGSVREYLQRRFPALAEAPVVDSRICTYELTVDEHLLIDRHPTMENLWLVGGGSGHGFKLGPVVGEEVADLVGGSRPQSEPRFRLTPRPPRAWREA